MTRKGTLIRCSICKEPDHNNKKCPSKQQTNTSAAPSAYRGSGTGPSPPAATLAAQPPHPPPATVAQPPPPPPSATTHPPLSPPPPEATQPPPPPPGVSLVPRRRAQLVEVDRGNILKGLSKWH
ncbi:unnamed protein product [Lactuca saligna]|uniref:Uncharacterized protein n=1 Tax=Lactuca saligna TaxID=75948 RepID=A0AA35VKL0_LACSI|nr:unnamed protein product [Lactuca saligna]